MRTYLLVVVIVLTVTAGTIAVAQLPVRQPIQVQQPNQNENAKGNFPEMTAGDCANLADQADAYPVAEYNARQRFCTERQDSTAESTEIHNGNSDTRFGNADDNADLDALNPAAGAEEPNHATPDRPIKGSEEPNHSITGR